MIANYHTHTFRCQHAIGSEEQYIRKAIAEGLETLGFSDHTPQPYEEGLISSSKMGMSELDNYFSTLTRLREKFSDKIRIHIGFETEYYPAYWNKLMETYRKYPVEYMILGQHYVDSEFGPTAVNVFQRTNNKDYLTRFVDQILEAIGTRRFTYIAHPDVFYYDIKDDKSFYEREIGRLIEGAKAIDIPLEVNLLGLHYGRHYPNDVFWDIVSQVGNRTIIGCDAHTSDDVANPLAVKEGEAFVKKHRLNLIEKVDLVKPNF